MIILYLAVIIFLIFLIIYFIPGYTSSIKAPGGIASLEKVKLGGTDQWILIRGVDITKPVILFLHGGPGTSNMGLLRKYSSELEKHFVMVSWDQRGAAKSFAAKNPESDMTIERFIQDTYELTKFLCSRFNKNKIFLAGHSWGTVLGVLAVQRYPELFVAYIGIAQIVNMQENEKISYEWTLEQAKLKNDNPAVKKLLEIGTPPYTGDFRKKIMIQRKLLGKFGGEFYSSTSGAFPAVISSLIRSTEYSLADKMNFFRGIFSSIRLIWPELMNVNLKKQVPRLEVPVYFILGRHDYEAPSAIAEDYFNSLAAPDKNLFWFESSAHLPNAEESKKFNELLIKRILPGLEKN